MTAPGNERGQRRETKLTGRLGVLHRAFVRLGIDAVTGQLHRLVALFAIHLREDAVARRAAESLKRSLQPIALALVQIGASCEAIAFLDHHFEEVLVARIDRHLSAKHDRLQSLSLAYRLDLERLDNARLFSRQENRGHQIGPRIPERIVRILAARVDVVHADLPIVAAILGSQRQHVAIRDDASEACEPLPVGLIQNPFGSDGLQECCELLAGILDYPDLARSNKVPESHQHVHRGILAHKVGVDNRHGNFAHVGARTSAEERRFRIAEIPLRKVRHACEERSNTHCLQIRLTDRSRRVGFRRL
jgi:hypothetical protein